MLKTGYITEYNLDKFNYGIVLVNNKLQQTYYSWLAISTKYLV